MKLLTRSLLLILAFLFLFGCASKMGTMPSLDTKKSDATLSVPAPPVVSIKKDSDQDGVYDEDDQCPGTPIGAKVNAVGC